MNNDLSKATTASELLKWASENTTPEEWQGIRFMPEVAKNPHYWEHGKWKPIPDSASWFHGGSPGLKPGDWLLPQSATGTGVWTTDPKNPHRDFVFISPYIEVCMGYAIGFPTPNGGSVYRVQPQQPIYTDTYSTMEFCCLRARIVEVVYERVSHNDFAVVKDSLLSVGMGPEKGSMLNTIETALTMIELKAEGLARAERRKVA